MTVKKCPTCGCEELPPVAQVTVDRIMFNEASWADQHRFLDYQKECIGELKGSYGFQAWLKHGKPSIPLG